MASVLVNYVGKKIFKETAKNHFGQEDPYFEEVPAERLNNRPSAKKTKTKKRRKALPPGISENDAKVLTKVKRRAYRLDLSLFNCCGIRFGWSSVIGIIPFAGDALDVALAMMVVRTCNQIDGELPKSLRVQMMWNVALDFVIGLVPFLGDVADALYKCNTRNAVLLEKHLRKKGTENLKSMGRAPSRDDPSLGEVFDQSEADLNEFHGGPPPQYEGERGGHGRSQPPPAQDNGGRGYFGGGRRDRNEDVEMEEGRAPPQPPRPDNPRLQKQSSRR